MPLGPAVSRIAVCGDLWSALTRPVPAATDRSAQGGDDRSTQPRSWTEGIDRQPPSKPLAFTAHPTKPPGRGPGPGRRPPAPDHASPDLRVDHQPHWSMSSRHADRRSLMSQRFGISPRPAGETPATPTGMLCSDLDPALVPDPGRGCSAVAAFVAVLGCYRRDSINRQIIAHTRSCNWIARSARRLSMTPMLTSICNATRASFAEPYAIRR